MTNRSGHGLQILLLIIFSTLIPASGVSAVELCPFVHTANGAIAANTEYSSDTDFSAGLLGTFDRQDTGNFFAGMDWLYSDAGASSTTSIGGQLIGWWILKGGRSTELQVTNQSLSSNVSLHVQIFDENCVEIVDFCDSYTPEDTHTYDMANIVRNNGMTIGSVLTGNEGFVTVTPNVNCGTDFRAIAFPQLSGDMRIKGPQGYQYGAKMWARDTGTLFDCSSTTDSGSKILDGVGDCGFETVLPSRFTGVYSTLPASDASRSDLVFINMSDIYTPTSYIPVGGLVGLSPIMFDLDEIAVSCPLLDACYKRVGLNPDVPVSDTPLPPVSSPCDSSAPGAVIGTSGDDVLTGTDGNDVIIGLGGNDVITGAKGDDCLDGGPGNDAINGSKGADLVFGGTGNDDLSGDEDNDEIHGDAGDDTISGGKHDDALFGDEGADTIEGDKGKDEIDGGEGDDTLGGGDHDDNISGGDGDDTLGGGKGQDNLDGGAGTDTLDGGQGNDTCVNGETNISC